MRYFIFIFVICFSSGNLFGQQFLDEMDIQDISNEADVRSTIIRDPDQALLIVKTQIPGIRFVSNNIIHQTKQVETGLYRLYLNPGTHRIVFQAEGFISSTQRFYFNPKETKGVQIRVVSAAKKKEDRNSGIVVIKSEPDNAEVYINGDFYGRTPYLGKLLAGRYELELRIMDHIPEKEHIVVLPGETIPLDRHIRPQTKIEIISDPANAELTIDSEKVGQTPFTIDGLHIGKHKIKLELDNHLVMEDEILIRSALDTLTFNYSLNKKVSQLVIDGFPARSKISLNDLLIGYTPVKSYEVPFGSYRLMASKDGYHPYYKQIEVNKIEPYAISINLEPKSMTRALIFSALIPGSGQFYLDQNSKGLLLGAAALGSAGLAFYYFNEFNSKSDQYDIDKLNYENNIDMTSMTSLYDKMEQSYREMEDAASMSNLLIGAAVTIWAINIMDIALFAPRKQGVEINAGANQQGLSVSLQCSF